MAVSLRQIIAGNLQGLHEFLLNRRQRAVYQPANDIRDLGHPPVNFRIVDSIALQLCQQFGDLRQNSVNGMAESVRDLPLIQFDTL